MVIENIFWDVENCRCNS